MGYRLVGKNGESPENMMFSRLFRAGAEGLEPSARGFGVCVLFFSYNALSLYPMRWLFSPWFPSLREHKISM